MNDIEIGNPQKAIALLAAIPDNEWDRNHFSDGECKCCALGHLSRVTSDNPTDYSELNCGAGPANKWDKMSSKMREVIGWSLADINDGKTAQFQQETPKQRVLAALQEYGQIIIRDRADSETA